MNNIVKEEYIPYDLAILLKELGYNEKCEYEYDKNKNRIKCHYSFATNNSLDIGCLCTTISYGALDEWLRKKYYAFVCVKPFFWYRQLASRFSGEYKILNKDNNTFFNITDDTFEKTREKIFLSVLNYLIKENEISRN